MEVRISGIDKSESANFFQEIGGLLASTRGPLRLTKVKRAESDEQILFLRERTWSEFFLENLIRTPQELTDIQNETLAAIELALFPLSSEAMNGTKQTGGKTKGTKAGKGGVSCLDDVDPAEDSNDSIASISDDDIDGNGMHIDGCKGQLMARVLYDKALFIEEPVSGLQTSIRSSNGLVVVPKGLSISTCPALQVVAHTVIVGSVGAVSAPNIKPYSAQERAVEAFKNARGRWGNGVTPPTIKQVTVHNLRREKPLRHVQSLMFIPDDSSRDERHDLAKLNETFWKNFYKTKLNAAQVSVVRDLYPDYYIDDENVPGKRKPVYSDANIKGAIAAAIEVRREMREKGKAPVSIMFAGMDQDTYDRMSAELKECDVPPEEENPSRGNKR